MNNCPNCNEKLNGRSEVGNTGRPPEKDDITMCVYCKQILTFNADLSLRKLSKEEFDSLPFDIKLTIKLAKLNF